MADTVTRDEFEASDGREMPGIVDGAMREVLRAPHG